MERDNTYLTMLAKQSAIFDGIGIDNLSSLLSCLGAKRRRLARGEALMLTGDKADRIGILL